MAKPNEVPQNWVLIDAKDLVLGRMSSYVARLLRGKHKPQFTPHTDCGDNVVIINAEKVHVTGNKLQQNKFYWHTGHPGGIKERTWGQIVDGRFPERLIQKAVERMMPKDSPLARGQMAKLHVYAGETHPHEAQKPQRLDMSTLNNKIAKRA
jgi:large subunit ribosomal protein L13